MPVRLNKKPVKDGVGALEDGDGFQEVSSSPEFEQPAEDSTVLGGSLGDVLERTWSFGGSGGDLVQDSLGVETTKVDLLNPGGLRGNAEGVEFVSGGAEVAVEEFVPELAAGGKGLGFLRRKIGGEVFEDCVFDIFRLFVGVFFEGGEFVGEQPRLQFEDSRHARSLFELGDQGRSQVAHAACFMRNDLDVQDGEYASACGAVECTCLRNCPALGLPDLTTCPSSTKIPSAHGQYER